MVASNKLKKNLITKKGQKMSKNREDKNLTKSKATQKNDKNALWINTIYKIRQEKTIKNMSFKICKKIFYQ